MKNSTIKLLLPIVFVGCFLVVLVALVFSGESSSDTLPLKEVWTYQAVDRIIATPILIDDQVIFRTANTIYSISVANGSMNWEITSEASVTTINASFHGKPVVGNSEFLLSEEQNNSIGIYSTETGDRKWTVAGEVNFINTPIEIVDDIMIVARHDGNLVVYDLTAQQKLWEVALPPRAPTPIVATTDFVVLGAMDALRVYSLEEGSLVNEKTFDEFLIGEIALNNSNIFISYTKEGGDWTASSLQINSLNENWMFHAGKITHPYFSVGDDYLGLFNETLLLLDPNTGNVLWEDSTNDQYSEPAFHENSVFFISSQGLFDKKKICEAEISKGMIADCFAMGTAEVRPSSSLLGPLVANNLLIIPQDSKITAFALP